MSKHRSIEAVTFGLDGEIFAIEAGMVREILDLMPVTEVPNSPPFMNSLLNVRGKMVPLADLRVKFGMPLQPPTADARIVVIDAQMGGAASTIGLLADKVYDVTELSAASMEDAPRIGMKWNPEFIKSIGKRDGEFIIVLDIGRVLATAGPGAVSPGQPSAVPA